MNIYFFTNKASIFFIYCYCEGSFTLANSSRDSWAVIGDFTAWDRSYVAANWNNRNSAQLAAIWVHGDYIASHKIAINLSVQTGLKTNFTMVILTYSYYSSLFYYYMQFKYNLSISWIIVQIFWQNILCFFAKDESLSFFDDFRSSSLLILHDDNTTRLAGMDFSLGCNGYFDDARLYTHAAVVVFSTKANCPSGVAYRARFKPSSYRFFFESGLNRAVNYAY